MKKFLVILNCFLGVLLFVLLISCLAKLTKKEQAYEVKKRSGKKVQTQDQSKRTKLVIEPEKQVETIVTTCIMIGVALWNWWKNNSFTKKAIAADKYMETLK